MGVTPILLAVSAVVLAWPWIKDHWQTFTARHYIFAALIAAAAWTWSSSAAAPQPTPTVPAGLSLRGQFVGTDAARDAYTVSSLCAELADEIEWDGTREEPFLRTGVAFDELRIRSRALMCRGESLGDKHPRVRETIRAFLDSRLGVSGGPVNAEQRAKWCAAYREIARAAHDAAR